MWKLGKNEGKDRVVILKSVINYKNTHNEVYIQPMCKGAHVWVGHRYLCVSPTLNVLRSGGSRISHLSTRSYLKA